jgi:hypothetical protein
MSTIELLDDIGVAADLSNGAVISEAFRLASIGCDECFFPKNASEFRMLLRCYTRVKIKIHRARRAFNDDYPSRGFWHGRYLEKEAMSFAAAHRSEYWREARALRDQLSVIWPCLDCMERYNPTCRKAHGYDFNFPQGKGFIE